MRVDQEWEGSRETLPAAAAREDEIRKRRPVWCECSGCGRDWQSRAKDHTTLRCPGCSRSVRVPRRRWENTQDRPRAVRPVPFPTTRAPRLPRPDVPPRQPEPEQEPADTGPSILELITQSLRSIQATRTAPRPQQPVRQPQPQTAPATPAQAPHKPPAPVFGRPALDAQRHRDAATVLRALGLQLRISEQPPAGSCELFDEWRNAACTIAATFRVMAATELLPRLDLFACNTHGPAVADRAHQAGMATQINPR